MGRTMFGVMDETGLLEYGQVFVQYSQNTGVRNRYRGKNVLKVKGKVMVTKNPCTVPGDIRLLKGVDVPQLSHLVDVIVFPQNGPRPHPDEMAGSDLDGDEYSVIWDPMLMFDRNEEPMDYAVEKVKGEKVSAENLVKETTNFIMKYMESDSIGPISIAHLVNADLYGSTSPVCKILAKKAAQAVDFPKSGIKPEPLTATWSPQEDIPPERPERYPDYLAKDHKPVYESQRLVGQIYRRCKAVNDIFELTENDAANPVAIIDHELLVDGREEYVTDARRKRDRYNGHIRALMERYGVMDEGQLISGALTKLRNRISEREHESGTEYTTDKIIDQCCADISQDFRKKFFKEFGGIEQCSEEDENGERVCTEPTAEMLRKASAWYLVTYQQEQGADKLLSFPWIVGDVLASLKRRSSLRSARSSDPFAEKLTAKIKSIKEPTQHIGMQLGFLPQDVEIYMNKHGFRPLLAALLCWTEQNGLLSPQLVHTFTAIMRHDISTQLSPGQQLCEYLRILSSRAFVSQFQNDLELMKLHRLAVQTYYHVALTGTFQALGLDITEGLAVWDEMEMDPIVIELPSRYMEQVEQKIRERTGVEEICFREMNQSHVIVSARGTLECLHSVRALLMVKPPSDHPSKYRRDSFKYLILDSVGIPRPAIVNILVPSTN